MKPIDVKAVSPADSLYMIDVRSPDEYAKAHVAGSINVPLDTVRRAAGELKTFPKVIVVCNKGIKARQAAEILEEVGLKEVFVLEGGIEAWKAAHRPLAADPATECPYADKGLKLAAILMVGSGFFKSLRWITTVFGALILIHVMVENKRNNQPCPVMDCLAQWRQPLGPVAKLFGWRIEKL
jgi:rhodanese-related sulfurtransferase